MSLYKRLAINTFKSKMVFRANYIIGLAFSFFYIILQVFIWKGLYGTAGGVRNGVNLNEMVVYAIFSSVTAMLTNSKVMDTINSSVLDGSIAMRLLLPIGFQKYYFISNVSENLFLSLYNSLPPILAAAAVFGINVQFTPASILIYCVSVVLAFALNFLYNIIMGLSVLWLRNAFFLENFTELVFKLFSGAIVPMWFFPGWLNTASYFLPFRYIIFEPISLLLGKTPIDRAPWVLGVQCMWLIALFGLMSLIWSRGRKLLMIQGG